MPRTYLRDKDDDDGGERKKGFYDDEEGLTIVVVGGRSLCWRSGSAFVGLVCLVWVFNVEEAFVG